MIVCFSGIQSHDTIIYSCLDRFTIIDAAATVSTVVQFLKTAVQKQELETVLYLRFLGFN